jgi:hypothetical protein
LAAQLLARANHQSGATETIAGRAGRICKEQRSDRFGSRMAQPKKKAKQRLGSSEPKLDQLCFPFFDTNGAVCAKVSLLFQVS